MQKSVSSQQTLRHLEPWRYIKAFIIIIIIIIITDYMCTRQVTRATDLRNRVCPRVELILKIIIILRIIFLGFIKSKPC